MRHQSVINQWGFKNPITFYIMYKGVWKWILMCGFVQEWGGKHCAFYHRDFGVLHQPAFTQTLFYTKHFFQKPTFTQASFCTNSLFHKPPFTPTSSYTNELLHAPASTQSNFSTDRLLHKARFAPTNFYKPAFTQISFYTNQFLDKAPLTQTTFYTNQLYTTPALVQKAKGQRVGGMPEAEAIVIPQDSVMCFFSDDWRTYLTGFHC